MIFRHDGGGNAHDADRSRLPGARAGQRMGNVRLFPSLRGGTQIDIDMVALDLNGIGRHTVLFIARLTLAALMVNSQQCQGHRTYSTS